MGSCGLVVQMSEQELFDPLRLWATLAEYEGLAEEATLTEDVLSESLFDHRAYAETLLAEDNGEPVGLLSNRRFAAALRPSPRQA